MIPAVLVIAQASAPLRHLVYTFTYADTRTVTAHTSGFDSSGSGVSDSRQADDAKGSIVVDVLGVAPDKGLIVTVSEHADNPEHEAPPAQCIVYPAQTKCDLRQKLTAEEVSLIRLLANGFVDPARIDANNHWHVDDGPVPGGSDYTVLSNDHNAIKISERRSFGSGVRASTVTGTIDYNLDREVVTALSEVFVSHPRSPDGADLDDTAAFNAALQSDSMAH